jgi:hypothetical protein
MRPSVPELVRTILQGNEKLMELAPGGIFIGPANAAEQKKGCVVLGEAGIAQIEEYLPLERLQLTARCLGPSIDAAERIATQVYEIIHSKGRRVVRQASTGKEYLVHGTMVRGGPVIYTGELENLWQEVLTLEALVGTDEIT